MDRNSHADFSGNMRDSQEFGTQLNDSSVDPVNVKAYLPKGVSNVNVIDSKKAKEMASTD